MIVFIANQFIGDKIATGGDVLFIEMLSRASRENECTIIAPLVIHKAIISKVTNVFLVSSDSSVMQTDSASTLFGGFKTVIKYIKRSYTTYKWLSQNDNISKIYLTGDFICNTLPVYIFSKTNNKPVYSNFFHRNPKPLSRPGNLFIVSLISRFLQGISLRFIKKFSNITFVLTELGRKELIKGGFQENKIIISGAGVDSKLSNYRSTCKNKNQIVYVGRLNRTKGVYDLIRILIHLDKLGVDYVCYLVGGVAPYEERKIHKIAKENNIDSRIKIMGYVSEAEKIKLIASSKVFAFPSMEEGYGIVVQEALKLHTAVVCYDLPVLKLLFHSCKLISYVPFGDVEMFAKRIDSFLNKDYSSDEDCELLKTWDDVYNTQFNNNILLK